MDGRAGQLAWLSPWRAPVAAGGASIGVVGRLLENQRAAHLRHLALSRSGAGGCGRMCLLLDGGRPQPAGLVWGEDDRAAFDAKGTAEGEGEGAGVELVLDVEQSLAQLLWRLA